MSYEIPKSPPLTQEELYTPGLLEHLRAHLTWQRVALGALALSILGQNVDVAYTGLHYRFAGGDKVPTVPGCESTIKSPAVDAGIDLPLPKPNDEAADNTDNTPPANADPDGEIEQKALRARSSARHNSALKMVANAPLFMLQNERLYDYFEGSYTSEKSGIIFEVYRTAETPERTIDMQALDELYHLPLTANIVHPNRRINNQLKCIRERVLKDNNAPVMWCKS